MFLLCSVHVCLIEACEVTDQLNLRSPLQFLKTNCVLLQMRYAVSMLLFVRFHSCDTAAAFAAHSVHFLSPASTCRIVSSTEGEV